MKPEEIWAGLNKARAPRSDITIVGIPYDGSVCYRKGAAQAPDRIREISSEIPPVLETGEVLTDLILTDYGNIEIGTDPVAGFPRAEKVLSDLVSRSFLLTIGGDHSVSIPIFRTLSRLSPEEIGMVFIDAHTDLSPVFDGSPLSHACPLRRALELPRFSPENAVIVGVRCFEIEGLRFIQEKKIPYYTPSGIGSRGLKEIASEIRAKMGRCPVLYLSIDIDVLDPAFAPGTGIPEAGGLSTRDVLTLVRELSPLPFIGADLVEVSPPLDISDITSFAALKIIMEICGLVARRTRRGERTSLFQK